MDARTLHALLPIVIVAGLLVSVYAAYESTHPAAEGACSVSSFVSCQKVDRSSHTTTFGIPDYWIGIGGFLALLAVDVPLLATYRPVWRYALVGLSALGLVASAYFAYVELVVIRALCLVCAGAYAANVVVFALGVLLVRAARRPER